MNMNNCSKLPRILYIIILILITSNFNLISEESEWIHLTGNSARITCFAEDGDYLWMGVSHYGLIKYNMTNDEYEIFDTPDSLLKNSYITSIIHNDDSSLWIGTYEAGILKKSGNSWQVFDTTNSGLLTNQINCLAKDKSGDLWIGTYGAGVFKYDGLNWTNYNTKNSLISDNYITTIYVDEDNKKWIGSGEDLVTNIGLSWASYNAAFAKFSTGRINSIQVEKNGSIWLVTDDGVSKYEGTSWKVFNSENSILPESLVGSILIIDKNGNKWIAMYSRGLFKYDDKEWTVYNRTNSGLKDNSISAFFISQNDTKWIGTLFEQIVKFDGNVWKQNKIYNSELGDNVITDMTLDKQGNILVNLDFIGFAKFNYKEWQNFTTLNFDFPCIINDSRIISVDSSGNIWKSSNLGIQKFDGTNWTLFTHENSGLPDNGIRCILIDKKSNKYISTYSGLVKYDDVNWTKLGIDYCISLFKDDDDLIAGLINGISKFDGINWIPYSLNISYVNSIAKDKKGNLWFACNQGLIKYDGTNWKTYDSTYTGFNYSAVYKIAIDENDVIWLISEDGELSKFDGNNWKFIKKYYDTFLVNNPTSLLIDKYGNKWIGTRGQGIFIYREGGVNLTYVEETPEIASHPILIYPNPVSDILTISGEWKTGSQYIITDYLGYEIRKGNLTSNEITVSSLTKGMYFITIRDGVTIKTLKFMKM